ncbi:hypothetical protein BD309DRAFT_968521 [Dichomitus squalens]|uniref:Uncharacterized protein n=1 Tax=Dichomitus squalens TaxID=114155 RepID=A0A4Q9NFU3_9APHY|nr:hypothetical protein BD309DRAFT_968521 [Dichomitus squalens]TBU56758.1 hypothetical protein BD310DRAFT_930711 [Dichomitus squalens]
MSCLSAWNCELEYPSLLFYPHRLIAFFYPFVSAATYGIFHLPLQIHSQSSCSSSCSLPLRARRFSFAAVAHRDRPRSIDVYHHPAAVPRSRARIQRNLCLSARVSLLSRIGDG